MGLFGKTKEVTLKLGGLTCEHCKMKVKKALEAVDGVKKADVDLGEGKAIVKFDPDKVETSALESAVKDVGYSASAT